MKATELRIGNYVVAHNLGHTVLCIAEKELRVALGIYNEIPKREIPIRTTDIEEFTGIPLTEEWLLKFGLYKTFIPNVSVFEFYYGDFKMITTGKIMEQGKPITGDVILSAFFGTLNCSQRCEIKFIHQLQNLYFALTGEELTIK